jgi:hypothetical protein
VTLVRLDTSRSWLRRRARGKVGRPTTQPSRSRRARGCRCRTRGLGMTVDSSVEDGKSAGRLALLRQAGRKTCPTERTSMDCAALRS